MSFRLEDIASFQKGFAFKSKDFIETGIKIVKVTNLTDESVNVDSCASVSFEVAKACEKYDLYEKDIIITTVGSWPTNPASIVGKVVRMPKSDNICLLNQNAVRIRSNMNISQDYLYYLLRNDTFKEYIIGTAQGSANQASITQKDIKNFNVELPDLEEQKAVAHILSTLDDKIEVNNEINKTLENMAQAIFKQWFVDFEFPNEDGEPYKSSGGEMIESELGMIPKGWEVKDLGEIIDIHDSKRIPLSKNEREKREKIYPYYGAASLMDYVDEFIFDGIYVLLGEDGTVVNEDGSPVLQYVWGKFWVNNHAHVLSGKKGVSTNFLYILLSNLNVSGAITGAVQLKINQKNLKEMKIIMPNDMKLVSQFSDIVDKSFEKIRVKRDENNNLVSLRDSLLPKLMSGEIRVPLDEEGDAS